MTRSQTIREAIRLKDTTEAEQLRADHAALPRPLAGEDDIVRRLRERMGDMIEQLDRISCGDVRRNDATVLRGIEVALRYSQPLPKQRIEHEGGMSLTIVDPYALPPVEHIDAEVLPPPPPVPLALPPAPVKAKAPAVRKKKAPAPADT